MDLKDARALITGGSDGIGLAIGKLLVEKGSRVALMARRGDEVAAVAREIGALGLVGDVSKPGDGQAAVARVMAEFGGIDILVNNAGFGTFAPLVETTIEDFERTFATNVTGATLIVQAVAPLT